MIRKDTNWYVGSGDEVTIVIYDKCKYDIKKIEEGNPREVHLRGVDSFEVFKALGIKTIDGKYEPDKFNEYLRVTMIDGSTATYRNSYVDLCVI